MNEDEKDIRDGIPPARLEIRRVDFYFVQNGGDGVSFFADYNLDSRMVEYLLDDNGVLHFGITRDGDWRETIAAPKDSIQYWKVVGSV